MDIFLAILMGGLFGFVLERAGAGDPDKILGMLRLKDLHLMKAIFIGIGASTLLLFPLLILGLLDPSHLSIKSMYPGVIYGGALLGIGWALAGFCPGTGVVAAGRGRKDALSYLLGGLVGAAILTFSYQGLTDAGWFADWWGGKATLVETGASDSVSVLSGRGFIAVAMILGAAMIGLGLGLPTRPGASKQSQE